jgi:hypothetical protein
MPPRAEVLGNRTIHGEETLSVPGGFEPPHVPFPLARRLVGVLRPIVQVAVLPVFDAREDLPLGSPVAFQPIGDDDAWNVPTSFEEPAEEGLRSVLVPPALHQDIEHSPVLIHGPPEIVPLPIDGEEHLIQVPFVTWSRPSAPELIGIGLPKLPTPLPDRFIGHDDSAANRSSSTSR